MVPGCRMMLVVLSAGTSWACADPPTEPPTEPGTGSLELTVATRGRDLDLDGYTATLDEGAPVSVTTNGSLLIPDLGSGDHTVALAGLQPNCGLTTPAVVSFSLADAGTATARFEVVCSRFWALAFNRPSGVQVTDLAGTAHAVLLPGGAGAVWSPDGRSLAAPVDRTLSLINEDGTDQRVLDDLKERTEFGPSDILWAPDGESLLYVATIISNSFPGTLYRRFLDGRLERLHSTQSSMTSRLGWAAGSHASWSPDGSRLAVNDYRVANTPSGIGPVDSGVYILDPEAVGTSGELIAPGGHQPEWSPDGSTIAFLRGSLRSSNVPPFGIGRTTVHLVGPDGSGDRQLTFPGEGQTDLAPAWSPDGSMIAFARYLEPDGTVIAGAVHVIRADGTGERKVVDLGLPNLTTVGWSPDGAYLAFTDRGVRVVAVDGSDLHTVGDEETCCPAWRP